MNFWRWVYLSGVFFVVSIFLGCVRASPQPSQLLKSRFKIVQVGRSFFVFKGKVKKLRFKGIKKLKATEKGFWIEPKKDCFSIVSQKDVFKVCLKPVPPVYPHLKVLKIDSYGVDLWVLSLFPKVFLLVWEKGKMPSFSDLKPVSPGKVELQNLSLGKTYLISGTIKLGENLYGPLSKPLTVKMEDKEPPLPPPGGGYLIKNETLILLWDPSPSRDVAGYLVEREGKIFKVKTCTFREKIFKSKIVYKIRAVDRAGNKSLPLYIKVYLKNQV